MVGLLRALALYGVARAQEAAASGHTKSAAEINNELSNPNTSLASLTFKNQDTLFDSDLPDANERHRVLTLSQPVLPIPIGKGLNVYSRPAIPIAWDALVPDAANTDFDNTAGLGDIGFDMALENNFPSGWIVAGGMVSSLPVGTDDLSTNTWTLGPVYCWYAPKAQRLGTQRTLWRQYI